MRPFFTQEHPIAFSHRGGAGLWPENTMEAFQSSYGLGYRFYEMDLHLSRDGTLVVLHDHSLERTTNGGGYVWDHDLEDLERLDAGHWFGPDRGYPYRGSGLSIPTVEEVLITFPDAFFTLEMKLDLAVPVSELISRLNAWDRVMVAGFQDGWLRAFRRITGGRVATSTSRGEIVAFWSFSRAKLGLSMVASAFQVPPAQNGITILDRRFLEAAHAVGKHVHVWTIDEPDEMRSFLDMGVDGIMTDRPDVLKEVLVERGRGGPWNR